MAYFPSGAPTRESVRDFYQSLVASAESNIRFDVALGGEEDE